MYIGQVSRQRVASVVWMILLVPGFFPLPARASEGNPPATPAVAPRPPSDLRWYGIAALPIEGKGWEATEHPFDRLPAAARNKVRPAVWDLSHCSSGLCVRFITDANEISARWTLRPPQLAIEHMAATGTSGLDLYARDGSAWRWVGLARPAGSPQNETRIIVGIPAGMHEYLMYLPLYSGVDSIEIGVNSDAAFRPAPALPIEKSKPIVFYGTSITQGASASRPGTAYTAILGRRFDRPSINLGFASNGTMDPELAALMGELDAAAFVIDCLPNMDEPMVVERTEPFVESLRLARPDTPIVLVECIEQQNAWFLPKIAQSIDARNRALRNAYWNLRSRGIRRLYYVSGKNLLSAFPDTAVDGIHPNDLGHTSYAGTIEPVLRRALRAAGRPSRAAR